MNDLSILRRFDSIVQNLKEREDINNYEFKKFTNSFWRIKKFKWGNYITNFDEYTVDEMKEHLMSAMNKTREDVYHQLQLVVGTDKDTYKIRQSLLAQYDSVLQKYPNHEERAYKIFKASNYEEFIFFGISCIFLKLPIARTLLIWYWILDFWMYVLFICSPPVIALYLSMQP